MAKTQADFITRTKIILQDDAGIMISDLDSGTATTGSTTTKLEDTTKSWIVDSLIGYYVRIISGTGIGQIRAIADNDATTCTVSTWVAPDTTSKYQISNDPELKALLTDAIELIYDKDHPLTKYKSYTGDGEYDYTKPSDWIDGFSRLEAIEYPSGNQEPIYLDKEKFQLYHNGTVEKIRFIDAEPSASQNFIVTYTIPHTLTDSANTIYEADFNAVCHLTAGLTLLSMANKYTQSSEPTIAASAVAFRTKSDRCRAVAEEQFKLYAKAMQQDEEVSAAIIIREYDTKYPWGGEYITHPPEWR